MGLYPPESRSPSFVPANVPPPAKSWTKASPERLREMLEKSKPFVREARELGRKLVEVSADAMAMVLD